MLPESQAGRLSPTLQPRSQYYRHLGRLRPRHGTRDPEAHPAFVVRLPECSTLDAMTDTEAGPKTRHEDGRIQTDGTADPAHRVTLSYIDRSRRYYASKGYEEPYRWVTND